MLSFLTIFIFTSVGTDVSPHLRFPNHKADTLHSCFGIILKYIHILKIIYKYSIFYRVKHNDKRSFKDHFFSMRSFMNTKYMVMVICIFRRRG